MMGGLQNGVVTRSKQILGSGVIYLEKFDMKNSNKLKTILDKYQTFYTTEYEIEVLIKKGGRVAPAILHGLDPSGAIPLFLDVKKIDGLLPGFSFSHRLDIVQGEDLTIISPSHLIYSISSIPRMQSGTIDHFVITDVPEIDDYHMWVRLPFVQNLIRKKTINRVRIYNKIKFSSLEKDLETILGNSFSIKSWEEENSELAWALKLETNVMISLFLSMVFLVTISIISGQLIFWNKIKEDLVGFWILGVSRNKIMRNVTLFFILMILVASAFGVLSGVLFLLGFEQWGGNVLPEMFVDRKVPILITTRYLLISFILPSLIAIFMSLFTLKSINREGDFLKIIRM